MTVTQGNTTRSHSESPAMQKAAPVTGNLKLGNVCFIEECSNKEPQLGRVAKELQPDSSFVEVEWMTGLIQNHGSYGKRKFHLMVSCLLWNLVRITSSQ